MVIIRKLVENKQPRRGDPDGVGEARWRIPIGRDVWDELRKPERYDESSWDGKRFQSIYGVPARMFDELVAEAAKHPTLCKKVTWGDGVKGPLPKPLELKVAAVLETCQAGLLFKTAERLYKISACTLEAFFHEFMRLQVLHEYSKHVYIPTERHDIDSNLKMHAPAMGTPGLISLVDGVKQQWLGCSHAERFVNTGKEGKPTRLWNVAGNAKKIIHHVHGSHPGARNDMTASLFDEYLQAIKTGRLYADEEFELFGADGHAHTHKGLYAGTDNGYHRWRILQCPSKVGQDKWLKRWSKRIESIRKPGSECIFGILKKRFRALALPCPYRDACKVDNQFRFLCSLHNRLQRHYGLDTIGDLPGDWTIANTETDLDRIALQCNRTTGELPHMVDDAGVGNVITPEYESSWSSLRSALVEHFKVQWEKNEIFWPKKATDCRPSYRLDPAVRRTGLSGM